MNADQVLSRLPFPQAVPVSYAAEVLGTTAAEIVHLVALGNWWTWSHSPSGAQAQRQGDVYGPTSLPCINEALDAPSAVLVEGGDELLWRWCVDFEAGLQGLDNGVFPSKESVEARLAFMKDARRRQSARAIAQIDATESNPNPTEVAVETGRVHTTKGKRRDALAYVIQDAVGTLGSNEVARVWSHLETLAESAQTPFLGVDEGFGLKYRDTGEVHFLTRKNLAARLARAR